MAAYEVWTSNDPAEWTIRHLQTDDREQAMQKAQQLFESGRFKFIAVDRDKMTIWSNDPDTPPGTI